MWSIIIILIPKRLTTIWKKQRMMKKIFFDVASAVGKTLSSRLNAKWPLALLMRNGFDFLINFDRLRSRITWKSFKIQYLGINYVWYATRTGLWMNSEYRRVLLSWPLRSRYNIKYKYSIIWVVRLLLAKCLTLGEVRAQSNHYLPNTKRLTLISFE